LDDDPSMTQLLVAHPRSLGYFDDPELTASRYVNDEDGVRWWKSGDIVAVDAAGVYHHHGRADELVKIRGMFVAPSRLEQELRTINGIGAAAVIATPTPTGKLQLIAHVQVDDDGLTPEDVNARLRRSLPRHLIPAIVVRHDELPSTDRHKVDRRTLEGVPLVRWRSAPARVTYLDLERWCLEEVRRIVAIDDIGPDDDLFEAGLDSLSTLELCAALADAGFAGVDPSQLLDGRTCARLCATLERTTPIGPSTVVAMNGAGTRPPVFVLPGGGGTALKFRFLAELLGADRPLLVIEPRGMHRRGRVDRSVAALAHHAREEVEARLGPADPCILLGYSASGAVAYEAAQLLHASGRPVHLVLLDAAPVRGRAHISDPFDDDLLVGKVSIRTASSSELPGAVMRSARYRSRRVRVWWFARYPGRPRYSEGRYRGFRKIMGKASREYEPIPAAFSASLIHIGNDDLVARTEPLIPDLSVWVVGGDHHTMLEMPEVPNLAEVLAKVTDEAFATTPSTAH
jgi:thioesterase domain-containing protein